MKKLVNLKQQSNEQLNNRLTEIAVSFRRTKAQNSATQDQAAASGSGVNTMYLGNLRKEKARILTILNERKTKETNS
jgi:ribosomal protein L29